MYFMFIHGINVLIKAMLGDDHSKMLESEVSFFSS